MLVLHDPATLLHSTVEFLGAHLIPAKECPERITEILKSLELHKHSIQHVNYDEGESSSGPTVLQKILQTTHDSGYLEHLKTAHSKWVSIGAITENESVLPECFPLRLLFKNAKQAARLSKPPKDEYARAGFYAFDMSAGISANTWKSALASANLAIEGAKIISKSHDQNGQQTVLALSRPPGHHCTTSIAGGYCYINNAVVAVKALQNLTSIDISNNHAESCIAILDIDFHHGNGTQEFFYEDSSVLYVSIHGEDQFPFYSGFADETGSGNGMGFNVNLPLLVDSSLEDYLDKIDIAMERIEKENPRFVIISLGFDTYNLDPLGSFKIFTEDYQKIAFRIRSSKLFDLAPTLILLEGGYVINHLGNNVISFLQGWENASSSVA